MAARDITTKRLVLIPVSAALARAALTGNAALAEAVRAVAPPTWPPALLDHHAYDATVAKLTQEPASAAWWLYFVVRRGRPRVLVGSAGFHGAPTSDGTVELGFAIVSEAQRQGYATELTHGLMDHAFASRRVRRVIADTLPEWAAVSVLVRCGFVLVGEGCAPGVVRYEVTRRTRVPAGKR